MNKKITIKDIARESGVSIATVSYIINNRKDQKISDETIKKVKQIINLYGYKPNTNAQNLTKNFNKHIAIYFPQDNSMYNIETKIFIDLLAKKLNDCDYTLVYLPSNDLQTKFQIDALAIVNASKEQFYQISNTTFCPLVAIDCLINDSLFYQINMDFNKLKADADAHFNGSEYTFLSLNFANENLLSYIKSIFPKTVFISSFKDISTLAHCNKENYVCINPSMQSVLQEYNHNVYFKNLYATEKFDLIIQSIDNAITRKENLEHSIVF